MTGARPIVIAGGGTAGHILPGLSIANAIVESGQPIERLRWIGSSRGQEASLIPPSGIDLVLLPGRGIQRRLTPANLPAAAGLVIAALRAFWIIGRHRPAVVLSLGGYASVAASVAAVIWRVPLVLAEQNVVAGAANRMLGRFAVAAAVPFEGTGLPRATVTGNPVRDQILALRSADPSVDPSASHDRKVRARGELGAPVDRLVVAVFAGSLGSRRINEAVAGLAEAWSDRSDVHIHHVVGRRDFETFRRPTLAPGGLTYEAFEYEERMDLLLAASDLAVCRAGGTTVAELSVIGVPSVLVPLPIAPGDHQRANAMALVDVGAAILVDDADCVPEGLEAELTPMIDDPRRLETMAAAAWSIGRPNAAADAAALVLSHLAGGA